MIQALKTLFGSGTLSQEARKQERIEALYAELETLKQAKSHTGTNKRILEINDELDRLEPAELLPVHRAGQQIRRIFILNPAPRPPKVYADQREARLAELRAQLEKLKLADDGSNYSRTAAGIQLEAEIMTLARELAAEKRSKLETRHAELSTKMESAAARVQKLRADLDKKLGALAPLAAELLAAEQDARRVFEQGDDLAFGPGGFPRLRPGIRLEDATELVATAARKSAARVGK